MFDCFQIGLRLPRVGEHSLREAIIDLKQYREEELRTVVDDSQWPLIVRLECMSEQGLQQGHSLSVSFSPRTSDSSREASHIRQLHSCQWQLA